MDVLTVAFFAGHVKKYNREMGEAFVKKIWDELKSQNIFLSQRVFTTIPARYLSLPCRQSLYSIQNPCLYCYEISLCCIQIETYSFRLEQL